MPKVQYSTLTGREFQTLHLVWRRLDDYSRKNEMVPPIELYRLATMLYQLLVDHGVENEDGTP